MPWHLNLDVRVKTPMPLLPGWASAGLKSKR
jgi:hypothetical protein